MPVDTHGATWYDMCIIKSFPQVFPQMTQMPRMTGAVTGNFGKAKVKAGQNEPSKYALSKKDMIIPSRVDGINRYIDAYNNTNDQRLKQSLKEIIRSEFAKRGIVPQNNI